MAYNLLDSVGSPADIRNFSMDQLRELCAELREYMIECCAVNPGHLGSSLGAVELVVGLHYVYDTPLDKVVFDVGHQAYAHKIITGRREAFRKNRMRDGISGFPKRAESEYDAFGAGHSSTSISAALGFAEASKQLGLGHKTVALIGDGSLTGGLALEGMNNAGAAKSDLLVILNDNNISIDRNIGALHEYLLHITSDPRYNKAKKRVWDGLGDGKFRSGLQRFVVNAKSSLVRRSGGDLFEAMGFRYFGPVDGNDISQVVTTLRKLKALDGPILLHTLTKKGKGYAPAEADQTVWHAPGMFDPETGERIKSSKGASRYQDVFGQVLLELARMDSRVVGVTPAMASGCGMNLLSKEMPGRFYDVGIEEEHAVTFSAGLAAGGMRPFCNIYSSFSQRAYDQILHDVCIQNLPVVFAIDRAGLVGSDGETHQGIFDLSYLSSIPNMHIMAPKNKWELSDMLKFAVGFQGPVALRYPRGEAYDGLREFRSPVVYGKSELLYEEEDIAILAVGSMVKTAVEVRKRLKEIGYSCTLVNARFVKPVDTDIITELSREHRLLVTMEENVRSGGYGEKVQDWIVQKKLPVEMLNISIPDEYVEHGNVDILYEEVGIDAESVTKRIIERYITQG